MDIMPLWCEQNVLPAHIGRKLEDGRKIVSVAIIRVYAYFHPNGDRLGSWLNAERWFKDQGCEIVSDEEYDSYRFRVFKAPGSLNDAYFTKSLIK